MVIIKTNQTSLLFDVMIQRVKIEESTLHIWVKQVIRHDSVQLMTQTLEWNENIEYDGHYMFTSS